ncbi:MAG TPA: hypothetical protein VEL49_11495 [Ktedonobacteraceae bacterium]|nr:hypothetical protein [Ktedonobacteraceae bacterium]
MRVREDFKQCVAFFGTRKEDGAFRANATGFFVSKEPDYVYLVTAKHVAENFPENTYVMRFNPQPYVRALEGYEHKDMEMKKINRWYIHPDDATVDIAVAPLASLSPRLIAHRTVPESMFFLHNNDAITYTHEEAQTALHNALMGQFNSIQPEKQPNISIGDETYTVGLYSLVPGRNDNVPVIRVGNIAMMPGEPIKCADNIERELYLIEMRSIAGLSGSPVFALSQVTNTYFLIGMIHGHHTIKESETTLHTGMALVTPIRRLLEILNQPELVELRQEQKALEEKMMDLAHRSQLANSSNKGA